MYLKNNLNYKQFNTCILILSASGDCRCPMYQTWAEPLTHTTIFRPAPGIYILYFLPSSSDRWAFSALGAVWVLDHYTYQSRSTIADTELVHIHVSRRETTGSRMVFWWVFFYLLDISIKDGPLWDTKVPSRPLSLFPVFTLAFNLLRGREGTLQLHLLLVPWQWCSTKYLLANRINH